MVFNRLRTRLSSLWRSGDSDDSVSADAAAEDDESSGATERDETLSYAEEVEYGVDERKLPDEDHVLRILVTEGGRAERSTVLEETGWAEERLERVVAEMEDDDQVSAITVGRRRVICRRGFEPKGYRSHLNE